MGVIIAKLFKNGQNQAVRIPRRYEFEGIDEVLIRKQGDSIIITPKRKSWMSFTELPNIDVDDFMNKRPELFDNKRVKF